MQNSGVSSPSTSHLFSASGLYSNRAEVSRRADADPKVAGVTAVTPVERASVRSEPSAHGHLDEVDISNEARSILAEGVTATLSDAELRELDALKRQDREIRAHEQAHLAAAGSHGRGGPRFTLRSGPDGHKYAVAGAVGIDGSPVDGDPEATIKKARTVRRAALAPAEPSAADLAIAARATRMEARAQQELREKRAAESADKSAAENEHEDIFRPAGQLKIIHFSW